MRKWFTYRSINVYCCSLAFLLLAFSGYLQLHLGLEPCPLCVLQRFVLAILLLLFFSGIFYVPSQKGRKVYTGIIFLVCLVGVTLAGRHVYLEHLPADQVPACGPAFNFLIKQLPLSEALKIMFQGTGDCAKVTWTFLYLSIAEWTLLFFTLFALAGFYQMARKSLD